MEKILIVEDEEPINRLIKMNLKLVGYECDQAFDGKEALDKIAANKYDLIILDIMLPYHDGFEVMKEIKDTPVFFVTARDNIEDKINAFSIGAEDYIVKPFDILELLARVNVILRRKKATDKRIVIDHIEVDMEGRKIYDNGILIEVTPQEFDLLETLILNRNLALSREKLLELAWDYAYDGDSRTVDVHIQKLRKKLRLEDRIKTVYKVGYRLEMD